jgi:hypothetical protein
LRVILNEYDEPWESKMVLRTTGVNALAMMMRAERARRCEAIPDTDWLMYGPTDAEAVEAEDPPIGLLAAE